MCQLQARKLDLGAAPPSGERRGKKSNDGSEHKDAMQRVLVRRANHRGATAADGLQEGSHLAVLAFVGISILVRSNAHQHRAEYGEWARLRPVLARCLYLCSFTGAEGFCGVRLLLIHVFGRFFSTLSRNSSACR